MLEVGDGLLCCVSVAVTSWLADCVCESEIVNVGVAVDEYV